MNSLFNSLKPEKQERIINAALKEFVQSGFDKASTNEIVKEAQISKGSLFNYFHNKKQLYFYLIDYGMKVVEIIFEHIDLTETDLFVRLEKLGFEKLQIQRKYPQVFDFLTSLYQEESDEVKADIQGRIQLIQKEGFARIYENIDYTKFRDDIDIQKAIEILTWTMYAFGEKAIKQLISFDKVGEEYLKEWESYSQILKSSFYK
ncbi:TetR/AcrR family transcriptional regulator [Bacillus sp. PS06]|uniref:TetR/AcrR family transcriptional regulator n=1 Tax=Bacillus sp. PS06 TaxID=2764176 RepID=UPI001780A5E5|nr:TetR/AcrR family transcriptional regulator [Bacillus sp. PS06]MBD8070050.1 TetR/AcrR family transcriptional regulator [Bacillus sp. PS06]